MYLFSMIVHILSAVAFVGYVFFDVCIFPFAKKHIDEDTLARVKKAYTKGSAKVFGTAFLLLIISGAYMAKDYFGGENGWLDSPFHILLATKIGVLGLMCLITAISLFFVKKKARSLRQILAYHRPCFVRYNHRFGQSYVESLVKFRALNALNFVFFLEFGLNLAYRHQINL